MLEVAAGMKCSIRHDANHHYHLKMTRYFSFSPALNSVAKDFFSHSSFMYFEHNGFYYASEIFKMSHTAVTRPTVVVDLRTICT